ncbi:MAG TPA: acyl-CoA dehydrogenase family protein [Alphaproteobacteria bacterium]|nr:acyl-CoA dehydrogenase family protein [Alphaproteobacteria bacterium]
MEFGFSEAQNILRDSVRKLMDKHAPPDYVRRLDREQAYPDALYAAWIEAGLLRLPFPEDYGGLGGSVLDMVIVAEELARKSADFFMAFGGSVFCGLNILRKASEAQKKHWLPRLLAGEIKFSISMSEPDAGSDVGAIRTSAVRDGDHWVINGQKLWATGAGSKNNVINVYVKTDPKAHYRQGLSLFLVDNTTPGVELRKLDMLGRRCVGTYEIFFKDVRVPADRLIGGENKGWDCILSGLQVERITSAAGNIGAAQACVDLAIQYAKDRSQFGRPIGTFQAIAHMLADMQTELEAARTLMWRAAWMVAQGQDALREISMAKLFSSETYVKVANLGMQIFGGYGYNMEFDMQRHFRDSRSSTIAAGSSQMQRNLIANLMGLKVS